MRRQFVLSAYVGAAALLAVPGAAIAQQSVAYTNGSVNLRAGPAQDYPVVAQLPGGLQVTVMGCVADYSWCDVALPDLRGWVYAGNLNYPYQGNNVPLLSYGTTIGVPIVTFAIGSYWGNYYRNRPWYRDQSRWANHPPPRPPGYGRPPSHGRPPPGHGNGRPPGPPPGHGNGGRPPGPPPGHGNGGRPPGPPPGNVGGGRPPGGGGGRPPGPPPGQGGGGGGHGGGGGGHGGGGGGNGGGHGGGNGGGGHGGSQPH